MPVIWTEGQRRDRADRERSGSGADIEDPRAPAATTGSKVERIDRPGRDTGAHHRA